MNAINGARDFFRVVIDCRRASVALLRLPSGVLGILRYGEIRSNGKFVRRSGFQVGDRAANGLYAAALASQRSIAVILTCLLGARFYGRTFRFLFLVFLELAHRFRC